MAHRRPRTMKKSKVSRKHTMRRSKTARRHRRKTASRKHKKGGMVTGVVAAAKTALLPYAMYKAQKHMQRKSKRSTKSRK